MSTTIVIVHGSWHTPALYSKIISELKSQRFEVHCPALPSACAHLVPKVAEDFDPHVDSDFLQDLLSDLVEIKRRDVFVVAHSSGGLWACEAIREELSRSFRQRSGKAGGVFGLMGISAWFVGAGTSPRILGMAGSLIVPHVRIPAQGFPPS
jgi:alpha-beta hydrolase superfamily lysophospholipase